MTALHRAVVHLITAAAGQQVTVSTCCDGPAEVGRIAVVIPAARDGRPGLQCVLLCPERTTRLC